MLQKQLFIIGSNATSTFKVYVLIIICVKNVFMFLFVVVVVVIKKPGVARTVLLKVLFIYRFMMFLQNLYGHVKLGVG